MEDLVQNGSFLEKCEYFDQKIKIPVMENINANEYVNFTNLIYGRYM